MAEIPGLKTPKWLISAATGVRRLRALRPVTIGPIWTISATAKGLKMSATLSTATVSRPLMLIALLVGLLLAATLGLWAYYGTTVFFEIVRAGWVACF